MRTTYLSVGECHFTIIRRSGKARGSTIAGRGCNTSLGGAIVLVAAPSCGTASKETAQEVAKLSAVLSRAGQVGQVILNSHTLGGAIVGWDVAASTKEVGDHDGSVNGTIALGPAKSTGFTAANLAVTDDGSVGLGAAPVAGAVTRSSIRDLFVLVDLSSEGGYDILLRPGIETPLAPSTDMTTPWAETAVARTETVKKRILKVFEVFEKRYYRE